MIAGLTIESLSADVDNLEDALTDSGRIMAGDHHIPCRKEAPSADAALQQAALAGSGRLYGESADGRVWLWVEPEGLARRPST